MLDSNDEITGGSDSCADFIELAVCRHGDPFRCAQ
jgi:hypothetical protein